MKITLRRLSDTDFPLLLAWLAKSHVKQWWDDGDDTLEKVGFQFDPHLAAPTDEPAYMMKILL
jgi:RimJ/RimL family protein N-acetyltransferase